MKSRRTGQFISYRQLIAVDRHGGSASWSGEHILGTSGVSEARDCVAAGNLLKTACAAEHHDRGLRGQSPAITWPNACCGRSKRAWRPAARRGLSSRRRFSFYHQQAFPLVSLRCDWDDDDPVRVLRRLWTDYEPQMAAYLARAIDPTAAPSYGVPGDP